MRCWCCESLLPVIYWCNERKGWSKKWVCVSLEDFGSSLYQRSVHFYAFKRWGEIFGWVSFRVKWTIVSHSMQLLLNVAENGLALGCLVGLQYVAYDFVSQTIFLTWAVYLKDISLSFVRSVIFTICAILDVTLPIKQLQFKEII